MLGCSGTKRSDPGLLPAIERYDGPVYRTLRAHKASGHRLPVILILSARYGLISGHHSIHDYDEQMTDRHAASLKASQWDREVLRLAWWKADDRFLIAGAIYRGVYEVMAPRYDDVTPPHLAEPIEPVYQAAKGRIGEQLHQLKVWLNT